MLESTTATRNEYFVSHLYVLHQAPEAHKLVGQRRKEHLKTLEAAQREQSSVQNEEISRLRRQNQELHDENEGLKRTYGSTSTSPAPTATSASPEMSSTAFTPYTMAGGYATARPVTMAIDSTASLPQMSQNMLIVVPHSINEIRSSLHALLAPVLDFSVISSPQNHLATLAALAPQLPSQLKPTNLQLSTPHHAYIDMIPSPTLRDRLINAGNANATAFMKQVCTIACEIEDHGQMTVWGEDWMNEFSWEFSAAVLEQWGWLLDHEWGIRANFWRRQRGATLLPGWDG